MQSFLISILTISFFLLSSIGVFADETTKAKANKDDAIHGYHAFGFAELSVASSLRQHAYKKYSKSLTGAIALEKAIHNLFNTPSKASMEAARKAWIKARNPYLKSEVLRFIFPEIDQWEGKVNAWPIDEGFIDYVALDNKSGQDNPYSTINIIANTKPVVNGSTIDASSITPELIANVLHQYDGIESNVAAGYHAIEFLLWGQDLNGHAPGAGNRSWTDFADADCTNGNCDRRAEYLVAATNLLVTDLAWMTEQWGTDGAARAELLGDETAGISAMLTGMGSLSYGETAGERMRLGIMLNDPEEEHDCFSDNTHNSHYYDGLGVQNVYLGEYTRVDGTVVTGASLADLVAAADPVLNAEVQTNLSKTMRALGLIKSAAEAGFSYDQMIERGNDAGEALVMGGVNGLIEQTRSFERVVSTLGLNDIAFEGSDSLDDPEAVFQ